MIDILKAQAIEAYLLERADWVHARELCERFDIRERELRGLDGEPGYCTHCAISLKGGYKHVAAATKAEYVEFKHTLRKHGINELRRVSALDERRHNVTRSTRAGIFERDTGQALLSLSSPESLASLSPASP